MRLHYSVDYVTCINDAGSYRRRSDARAQWPTISHSFSFHSIHSTDSWTTPLILITRSVLPNIETAKIHSQNDILERLDYKLMWLITSKKMNSILVIISPGARESNICRKSLQFRNSIMLVGAKWEACPDKASQRSLACLHTQFEEIPFRPRSWERFCMQ